jgi:mannose-6-phosphate isomerase-like protein (cupin superfamily)
MARTSRKDFTDEIVATRTARNPRFPLMVEAASNALKVALEESKGGYFLTDMKKLALANNHFRKVVYTGNRTQFTVMSLPPNGEIGKETHRHVEQIFFCVSGKGKTTINGVSRPLVEGDVLVVPQNTAHNIVNVGKTPLKFYTSYSPPNHLPNIVHATKADADADTKDEKFGASVR